MYPGLAVVEKLRECCEHRILWIGSNSGIERGLVEAAGVPFLGIPSGKLRRYLSAKNLSDLFRIGAGFFAARSILAREKPALLFSKGGFVSVPPCAAAASLGIPCFTHESDYTPGLATRLNARWVERILTAYPETVEMLGPRASKATAIGNPVRPAFVGASAERGRAFLGVGPEDRILLVLGGSQGARQVNELVDASLPELLSRYTVVHQTGPGNESGSSSSPRYLPFPYLHDELPHVLAAAHLVVGRSGAGTVWEAATAGKPMVLIPLAGSGTRGDQVDNAERFVRAGAAVSLVNPDVSVFKESIITLTENENKLASMAEASRSMARGDAASAAARLILERIGGIQ